MTAEVIPFPLYPAHMVISQGCPQCGRHDGTLNLKAVHWAICEQHKTKWRLGENLFTHWRTKNDSVWFRNAVTLQGYQEVQPVRKWKP